MSFRKHRPYRRAKNLTPTPRIEHDSSLNGGNTPDERKLWRIVGKQRARKLRKRGVPLWCPVGYPKSCRVWAETPFSYFQRKFTRDLQQAFRAASRRGPIYWNDFGIESIKNAVEDAIVKRLRLSPGESIFEIQTASPYQLDALFGPRAPGMTDEQIRQRVSPPLVLHIPGVIGPVECEGVDTSEPFVYPPLTSLEALQTQAAEHRIVGFRPELAAPYHIGTPFKVEVLLRREDETDDQFIERYKQHNIMRNRAEQGDDNEVIIEL